MQEIQIAKIILKTKFEDLSYLISRHVRKWQRQHNIGVQIGTYMKQNTLIVQSDWYGELNFNKGAKYFSGIV